MPDHAGFAMAITVRERVFSEALLLAYSRENFSRTTPIPFMGDGAAVGMPPGTFMGPPTVTCDGARNALVLGIDLTGDLSITPPTAPKETRSVVAHVDIAVPPVFELRFGQLVLNPPHTDVKVVTWTFTVVRGQPFSTDSDAYLHSPLMLERLSATVSWALDHDLLSFPSVDVSSLSPIITTVSPPAPPPPDTPPPAGLPVPARVVHGALLAGVNLMAFELPWHAPDASPVLTLQGDPLALADFARDYDVATATNPAALPVLLKSVEDKIVAGTAGDTLESLELTAGNGTFDVAGKASNSEGHADFSFSVTPHMEAQRPGALFTYLPKDIDIPPRPFAGLWFSTTDPHIDVSADISLFDAAVAGLVVIVMGVLMPDSLLVLPALTLGVWDYVDGKERDQANDFYGAVTGGTSGRPTARVRRISSAALANVPLRIAVEEFSITPDGQFTGITIKPEPKPGALIGPKSIPANLRTARLTYLARLPIGAPADDPALRIQWTVIDPATGAVKVDDDGPAVGRTTFVVIPNQKVPGLDTFVVGCRAYRTSGVPTGDILNEIVHVTVVPVPPSPAYVSWVADVPRPLVSLDPDSSTWTYDGTRVASRHSKIHRVNGGCTNADKRSRFQFSTTEMDVLPFPVADIEVNRRQLCDYCFFGGPAGLHATL